MREENGITIYTRNEVIAEAQKLCLKEFGLSLEVVAPKFRDGTIDSLIEEKGLCCIANVMTSYMLFLLDDNDPIYGSYIQS